MYILICTVLSSIPTNHRMYRVRGCVGVCVCVAGAIQMESRYPSGGCILWIYILGVAGGGVKAAFGWAGWGGGDSTDVMHLYKWQSAWQQLSVICKHVSWCKSNVYHTVPKEIDFPRYTMKCSGENEILRGIFHVVSRFPLHFMLYRWSFDYFSISEHHWAPIWCRAGCPTVHYIVRWRGHLGIEKR